MPKLTGEELSKLYPRAKTYDELQVEREQREIERTPKFVAAKIALWTALIVPTIFVMYRIVFRLIVTIQVGTTGGVLFGVCLMILSTVVGLAIIYYLYSLIDGMVSKTFAAPSLLYIVLVAILCIIGGLSVVLQSYGLNSIITASGAAVLAFGASFLATSLFKKYN